MTNQERRIGIGGHDYNVREKRRERERERWIRNKEGERERDRGTVVASYLASIRGQRKRGTTNMPRGE